MAYQGLPFSSKGLPLISRAESDDFHLNIWVNIRMHVYIARMLREKFQNEIPGGAEINWRRFNLHPCFKFNLAVISQN